MATTIKFLQPPDNHHLQAAIGWLELGNHTEANEELKKITPQHRVHPDVLQVHLHIYVVAQKWDLCLDIANAIIELDPDRPDAWIHRSFALHELKKTHEAFDQLLPVADKFPNVWTIPYNLTCYCAQTGRLEEECEEWFTMAVNIDEKTVCRQAVDDPDLRPLWESMGGNSWMKLG